jgi:hypothetical protein
MIKARIDASAVMRSYSSALRRLSDLTGKPQMEVLRGEAGIILKACMARTKVATDAKITRRAKISAYRFSRRQVGNDPTANKGATPIGFGSINLGLRAGREGMVWYRTKNNKWQPVYGPGFSKGFHMLSKDWPKVGPMVDLYRRALPNDVEAGKRAAGLARQSWLQIADALRINLNAVPGALSQEGLMKARRALAQSGKYYVNGVGYELGTRERAQLQLINSLPYGIAIGMDKTLLGVIAGRAKYFERSYAAGAFDSARRVARAYPWMRVRAAA